MTGIHLSGTFYSLEKQVVICIGHNKLQEYGTSLSLYEWNYMDTMQEIAIRPCSSSTWTIISSSTLAVCDDKQQICLKYVDFKITGGNHMETVIKSQDRS
jgi:hypothetical protein